MYSQRLTIVFCCYFLIFTCDHQVFSTQMAFEFLTKLKGTELQGIKCMVTGGCGFLGSYLVKMVLDAGAAHVVVLDAKKSSLFSSIVPQDKKRLKLILCDVRDTEQIHKAVQGVDIVFHAAAYFGFPAFSSNHFGDYKKVYDININGTSNVIKACIQNGIKSFIYTSSVNVVFQGTPIYHGDEKLPYALSHSDPYGYAKAKAERIVIESNKIQNIATCSLRPNGLYGPGETHNVGRTMRACQAMGGLYFSIGSLKDKKKAVSDWTFVENLAYANILAARELLNKGTKSKIAGQCYNITDGVCYNNVEFFKDLLEACGLTYYPMIELSPKIMVPFAKILELTCHFLKPIRSFQPITTPLEITKVITTHYFSIEKAKSELGCREVTAKYYKELFKKDPTSSLSTILLSLFLFCLVFSVLFYTITNRW